MSLVLRFAAWLRWLEAGEMAVGLRYPLMRGMPGGGGVRVRVGLSVIVESACSELSTNDWAETGSSLLPCLVAADGLAAAPPLP